LTNELFDDQQYAYTQLQPTETVHVCDVAANKRTGGQNALHTALSIAL